MVDEATMLRTVAGTPCYMAPEIWQNNPFMEYSNAVDAWSIGIVLYEWYVNLLTVTPGVYCSLSLWLQPYRQPATEACQRHFSI